MDFSLISKICIFVIVAILQQNSTEAKPVGSLASIPAKYSIKNGVKIFECPNGFSLEGSVEPNIGTYKKVPVCVPNTNTLRKLNSYCGPHGFSYYDDSSEEDSSSSSSSSSSEEDDYYDYYIY